LVSFVKHYSGIVLQSSQFFNLGKGCTDPVSEIVVVGLPDIESQTISEHPSIQLPL